MSQRKDLSKNHKIPVVVVESHNHVLEHIHHVLRRRRRLLNSTWSMLHFDSHADLACPGFHIPAVSCFHPRRAVRVLNKYANDWSDVNDERARDDSSSSEEGGESTKKKNLYELLDSTASGIAEWILPLVLAANLRAVHWIRPPGTVLQIPTGEHEYHVGAWCGTAEASTIDSFLDLPLTATVKVDWNCRYYLADDTYVSENELVLTQPLRLTVSEGPSPEVLDAIHLVTDDMIALDICLDYFACLNPFLTDIEKKDAALAKALVSAVTESKLCHEKQTDTYQFDLQSHHQLLKEFMELCSNFESTALRSQSTAILNSYYDASQIWILDALRVALLSHENQDERDELIRMAVDAIPNLTMPHGTTIEDVDGLASDVIQERLGYFKRELRHRCPTEPLMVTVARSTDDGFTPLAVVEELQVSVLHEIHEHYCGCASPNYLERWAESSTAKSSECCRLYVILDYGPWEGSTFP
jgi:hypothetical protein